MTEQVILLAEDGTPIGTADKAGVHTADTPLHLAFSCYAFSPDGKLLLTRRALDKVTWPGVWTGTCCGHPAPGESFEEAISRRMQQELGLAVRDLRVVLPEFRYRAVAANGVVENEICPVYIGVVEGEVAADPSEVMEWAWVDPAAFAAAVTATPFAFSPWSGWQVAQLEAGRLLRP